MTRDWARSDPAVAVREVILNGVLGPAMDLYTRRRTAGRDVLEGLPAPVLFVANHSSHMDTPVVLRALPSAWRRRTAVVAAADYFFRKPLLANTVSLVFNTVPIERKEAGIVPDGESLLHRLIEERWSLLIFAEGTRSRDGTIGRLHSGAALLAARHGLAIVPIHVSGTHAVMPPGCRWMRFGSRRWPPCRQPIDVRFGAPVHPLEGEHRTEVMERVRLFFESSGAVTTLDKRILARRRRSPAR